MELAARFSDPTVIDKNLTPDEKRTKDQLVFHELAQSEYTQTVACSDLFDLRSLCFVLTRSLPVGQLDRSVAPDRHD